MSEVTTGVSVHASHNPLAWMLLFVSPRVVINGEEHTAKWGKQSYELAPGSHEVEVFFPYLFQSKTGVGATTIEVKEGEVTALAYSAPIFMFSNGTIKVVS